MRYYDEIGLLRPAYVDEENHYRYYEEEQVDQILLISELKTYDLRLDQIKATIEISQVGTVIGSVFETIFKNGLQPAGPVMIFYLDREFHPEHANVEVCVPVAVRDGMEGIQGVKLFDPGLCATCTYVGEYSKLGKAYAAVLKWMEENQYEVSAPPFDAYMNHPKDVKSSEELVTQVWFPIKKK